MIFDFFLALSNLENNWILYTITGKKLFKSSFGETRENGKGIETGKTHGLIAQLFTLKEYHKSIVFFIRISFAAAFSLEERLQSWTQ